MTKEEALKKLQAIKSYMTSGNPMWSVEPIGEAMDMAIEALEQSQWISCGERLPKEYAQYLVCFEDGKCYVYLLDDSDWARGLIEKENIVAWMPLPEPYKEGEEDGRS